MKISILIFCLTVIFGSISCKIYSKEDINLIEKSADNGKQDASINFNVPLEQSLSRYKRASIIPNIMPSLMPNIMPSLMPNMLSPVTDALNVMGIGKNNSFIQTIFRFTQFVTDLLAGKEGLCPTRENLSFEMIKDILVKPIETAEAIACYIFTSIGKESRAMVYNFLKAIWSFLSTMILPGLHTFLNQVASTGLLPLNLRAMVETFNVFYNFLKMFGYIQ